MLYSTKWVNLREPQPKTQPQHTTTNMSHHCPTLQQLCPLSLSMGRAVAPPNHGASAPLHYTQAESHPACALCRWFARLGGGNERHQKIERRESALALGDHRLINYTQQSDNSRHWQWMGSWGRRATGAERVGGRRTFALVIELGGPAGEFPANIFETAKNQKKSFALTTTKNRRTTD